ncbi:universal stress protein [mine drainage metagenome]|uniref:Universal stress protein n=1 Tax=mine drainage metagenome TaxID=410659 RepID=T1B519_9ZZZZ
MYRQLLIPVKEASEVEPTIDIGARLLEPNGEIRILHIIPTTRMPQVTREWRASVNIVVPAHETGAALDVRVEPEVRANVDVPGEILESAEAHEVDAILMTLAGDRRSRNPFVGHTASAVLHHARCDVVIVNRLALAGGRVPRILLPTLGEMPTPRALQIAEELGLKMPGVGLTVLSLAPGKAGSAPPDPLATSPRGLPLQHKYVGGALPALRRRRLPGFLLQVAARERYGLLLIGEDSRAGGTALLTRHFLEDLFRAAPCPVIAVRS